MFDAIVPADTLTSTLEPLRVLLDECKVHLEPDGLKIKAIEPATVAMVEVSLSAEAFESYNADGGVIGVDISRLEDIVSMADSDELVKLALDEETRKLHIHIDGLEYTLALIDPNSVRQEPDIPDFDLPASVTLEGRDINRAVKAASMVSTHIALGVNSEEEYFYVDAEGDTDDVHLELDREELIGLEAGPAHSLFSLDYLDSMNKAIPSDAEVTLTLGEEFPTKINYDYAEGNGHISYNLAPRIQSN